MWIKQGNSEYISEDGLFQIKPHTNADGDNIRGDWALYAKAAYDWDYIASATTMAALKVVGE